MTTDTPPSGSDDTNALFKDNTPERLGLAHIDRYEVLEQIGLGAMGVVYRVHDPRFACSRALKILRPELINDPDIVQRFREEGKAAVRAAGEISHPNIITVYDAGDFEDRPYIVMELFKGVPLEAKLAEGDAFTPLEVLEIGAQLADALSSSHAHGVVHRDIKPGNVMISEVGLQAKLTDFSVAQLQTRDANSSLTHTGVVIGAPRYMPPEQAMGKTVDGRSDLYGLGIMLFEMLTQEKAYQSQTFTALLIEISQSQVKSVRSVNSDIPPGVDRIVARLVEKDPDRRFQTGAELHDAIQREMRSITISDARVNRGIPPELLGVGLLSAAVLIVLLFTGLALRNQQINALEVQTAATGMTYANALADQISNEYALSGAESGLLYQLQFDQITEDGGLDFHTIVLDTGRILASTEAQRGTFYEPYDIVRTIDVQGSEENQVNLVTKPDGSRKLQVERTIQTGPAGQRQTIGKLLVGFPTERITEIGKLTLTSLLLITLAIFLLISAVSYYLIRRFTGPMEQLRDMLRLVGKGDFDVRLAEDQEGMIGETFVAFNRAVEMTSKQSQHLQRRPQDYAEQPTPQDMEVQVTETDTPDIESLAPVMHPDEVIVDDSTLVFRLPDS